MEVILGERSVTRPPGKNGGDETPFPHQFCCTTLLWMFRDEQNIRCVDMLSDAALMLHELRRHGFLMIGERVRYRNQWVFAPINACNKKVADKRKIVAWALRLAAPLRLGAPGSSMTGCVNGKGGIVDSPCVGHGESGAGSNLLVVGTDSVRGGSRSGVDVFCQTSTPVVLVGLQMAP